MSGIGPTYFLLSLVVVILAIIIAVLIVKRKKSKYVREGIEVSDSIRIALFRPFPYVFWFPEKHSCIH